MTTGYHQDDTVSSLYQRVIRGSFIPNGSGAVGTVYGAGFTVSRTGVGTFLVTLDDPFADFLKVSANVQVASADTTVRDVRIGDISITNKTFVIKHLASADTTTTHPVAADISTSGTANKIHFECVVITEDIPGSGIPD